MKFSYLIASLLFIFSGISGAFAAGPSNSPEENACFELLREAVKNDSRFNYLDAETNAKNSPLDLSRVIKEETDTQNQIDVSTYSAFRDSRDCRIADSKSSIYEGTYGFGTRGGFTEDCKKAQKSGKVVEYTFEARRTHVATLLKGDDYVITQYSSFGNDTNFSYPYIVYDTVPQDGANATSDGNRTGLRYDGAFKNYLVYTHHLADPSKGYPFLSCGIIKVIPTGGNSYKTIGDYLSNTFGARYASSDVNQDGMKFRKLDATVPTINTARKPMADIEVLAFGYDNGSGDMNEYHMFKYADEAMKDPTLSLTDGNGKLKDNGKTGSDGSVFVYFRNFRNILKQKTCLRMVHLWNIDIQIDKDGKILEVKEEWAMPADCPSGWSGERNATTAFIENLKRFSIVASKQITSWIIPSAFALSDEDFSSEERKDMQKKYDTALKSPTYASYGFRLDVLDRLDLLQDRNLANFISLGLSDNITEQIKVRKQAGVELTDWEKTFMACPVSFDERVKTLEKFVLSIKDTKNIDYSNLSYENPVVGDCIVPYPDARHRTAVQPVSFATNKLMAEAYSHTGSFTPPKELVDKIETQKQLTSEFQHKLEEISALMDKPETHESYRTLREQIVQEYEPKIQKISEEVDALNKKFVDEQMQQALKANPEAVATANKNRLIAITLSIGGAFVLLFGFLAVRRKRTKNNK